MKFSVNSQTERYCPNHPTVKLIVKENRQNGNQFLGCPEWPDCDHTEGIPETMKMRALGQPELFAKDEADG